MNPCVRHDDCREHPELGRACAERGPALPVADQRAVFKHMWNAAIDKRGMKLGSEERVSFDIEQLHDGSFRVHAHWIKGFRKNAPYRSAERLVTLEDMRVARIDKGQLVARLHSVAIALVSEILPLPKPKGWRLFSRRPRCKA